MNVKILKYLFLLSLAAQTACATLPIEPSIVVVPAPGKPFELFRQEDASCRRWAEQQIGLSPKEVSENNTATGAITGTAIGAGLGALLGSASGQAVPGALIGAAGGMFLGASSGADSSRVYGRQAQRRYDITYLQCMYSYENQLPESYGRMRRNYRPHTMPPPPPYIQPPSNESIPPPPPGATPQTPPEFMDNRGEVQ